MMCGAILLLGRVPGAGNLGRLPGDISFQADGISYLIPIVSSIILSLILTVVLNLLLRVFNR